LKESLKQVNNNLKVLTSWKKGSMSPLICAKDIIWEQLGGGALDKRQMKKKNCCLEATGESNNSLKELCPVTLPHGIQRLEKKTRATAKGKEVQLKKG